MKSSDTSNSFATTGVGQRLDIAPDPWFMAIVTSRMQNDSGFFIYTLSEVEPKVNQYGYQTKTGGLSVSTSQEVNNAIVEVGAIVNARFRSWSGTTPTYEFWFGGETNEPYPYYPYYYGTQKDSIVIPVYRYRCNGSNLEESITYHEVLAPNISQVLHSTDPNLDGTVESGWWCVGGQCVESTDPPEGYNAGPYSTYAACAANCI